MSYLANLAVWATAIVGLLTLISAVCQKAGARFRDKSFREVATYNPPGALMALYGRALPILLRVLGVVAVVTVATGLIALLT